MAKKMKALSAWLAGVIAAVFMLCICTTSAFADTVWHSTEETVDNTQHVTTIYADRVLSEMPTDYSEFLVGYTNVSRMYCEGESYSRTDSSVGHLWFDLTIPASSWLGNSSPIFLEHSLMCIDRSLAAPGGSSGSAQGWPISWTGEKTYGELRARLVSTDATSGTATYVLTFYPTDAAGHTYQWLGYQRLQTQPYLYVVFKSAASLTLTKASSNTSITDGNTLYTMSGIQYGLYSSQSDAQNDSNRIYTFTSDANGNCGSYDGLIVSGTTAYYLREVSLGSSVGYELSSEIVSVSIAPGANTFTVTDAPKMDPVAFQKEIDGEPGGASLAGIRWTVSYWPAYYGTVAAAQAATAQHTWVVESDASGYARLSEEFKVDGDDILYDADGTAAVPLGTLVVVESSTNDSLILTDSEPRLIHLTASGPQYVSGYSIWTNETVKGKIEVQKTLVNSAGDPVDVSKAEGIQVEIISKTTGGVVETLTLDADGHAVSGDLVYDTYLCRERPESVPANIEAWYVTAGVDEDEPFATVDVHTNGQTELAKFTDVLTTQPVGLSKKSSDEQLAALSSIYADMTGATYGLYTDREAAEAAAAKGDKDDTEDGRIFTFHCDAEGRTETTGELECGQILYVAELSAPDSGAYMRSMDVVEIELTGEVTYFPVTEAPYSGAITLEKRDAETNEQTPQGDATFEGIVVTAKYWPVYAESVDDLSGEPEKTWTWTFGADGNISETGLPEGSYLIAETSLGTSTGYKLTDTDERLLVISQGATANLTDGGEKAVFENEAVKAVISVSKTLLNAGGSEADASKLAGIEIAVKDASGATVDTIVLDTHGKGLSKSLPIGTYTLEEVSSSVPAGVQPYAWTAKGSSTDIVFATVEIADTDDGAILPTSLVDYTATTQVVHKTDMDTGESLEDATITLYRAPDDAYTIADGVVTVSDDFDGTQLSSWTKVSDLATDSAGYVGWSMLPFGLYAIAETSSFVTPDGSVYLDEARSLDIDAEDPVIHVIVFDRDHESQAITIADKKVDIAVLISERTISRTAAALDATGQDYGDNNVGVKGQWWFISAANNSSVDTDSFHIEFLFTDNIIALGGRVVTVTTATTTGDKDGKGILYYTTDGTTWVEWAEISATEPARFEVSSLGTDIAGVKIEYGAVAKDFTVGTQYSPANSDDLAFEAIYTVALNPADNVTILHGSRVYTDLAVSSETTIWADDVDNVKTVVLFPKTLKSSFNPNGGFRINTGDTGLALFGAVVLIALAAALPGLRRRKANLAAVAGALAIAACLVIVPGMAFAEPATVEKTYTWMADEAQPAVPGTLTEKGIEYALDSVTEPKADPTFKPEEKVFTRTLEGSFATLGEAEAAYPASVEIDEDGFAGEIAQKSFEWSEIIGTYTRVDDVVYTFTGLPSDDVDQEALSGVDWDYSSVHFDPEATNSVGIPTSYTAVVTTKEATIIPVQTGVSVTVTYEGTLAKDETRYIVTATFIAPEAEPIESEPEKNSLSTLFGVAGGVAGAGIVAAGFYLLFPFIKRKFSFKIVKVEGDGEEAVEVLEVERKNHLIEIEIPEEIDLSEGRFKGYLRPRRIEKTATQVHIFQMEDGEPYEIYPLGPAQSEFNYLARKKTLKV